VVFSSRPDLSQLRRNFWLMLLTPSSPSFEVISRAVHPRAASVRRWKRAAAEAAHALLVILCFVAGGIAAAAGSPEPDFGADSPLRSEAWLPDAPYPGAAVESDAEPSSEADARPAPEVAAPRRWLVDGYNFLHAALLGNAPRNNSWWGEANRARVIDAISRFPDPAPELVVVFDGQREPEGPASEAASLIAGSGPRCVIRFAPSADEWIVKELRSCPNPAEHAVVTADRRLASRARSKGARVETPTAFLRRCRQA
jgi:predicted RNA-binding protein with PIN domain